MAARTIPAPVTSKPVDVTARRLTYSKALHWIAAVVALGLAGHLALILWSRHEFTPVESLVAIHSHMLAHGGSLYYDYNRYPFTVMPYGPIYYVLSCGLQAAGLHPFLGSRLLSFLALGTALWLCWRIAGQLIDDVYARATGVILAASTSNILFWGTVGQVDILAACFSLAAFTLFLHARERGGNAFLIWSGVLALLAIFTKQTAVAAGAAIGLTLLVGDRRRAAWWIPGVSLAGAAIAICLNAVTHGGYFADAIVANINPWAWFKLEQQARYLLLTGSGIILIAALGAWRASHRVRPLYLYSGLAAAVWLLTAPKIGSDLNYQVEMMLVVSVCAACALGDLEFFPSLFAARRTWVTLLQMPLLLHVASNVVLTGRVLAERALLEPFHRRVTVALKQYVDRPGLLYSGHYDSLVQYRGSIDVEPLIYGLLVAAGRSDPGPVLRDLSERRFTALILGEDLSSRASATNPELPELPAAQREAMRRNYRLVQHIDGYDLFVYEPKRD